MHQSYALALKFQNIRKMELISLACEQLNLVKKL